MKNLIYLIALCSSLSFFTGCASSKQNAWLQTHQTTLQNLANSNVNAEAKVDGLMTVYTKLMEEGLAFTNPAKGVKYIQKFQQQNQTSIDKILGESNQWVNSLTLDQSIGLGTRVAKKPYIKQAIDLYPKFKRKYEQYKFVLDMSNKVAGGFGKIGKTVLGILL